MNVLIVESRPELSSVWKNHLERQQMNVICAATQDAAITHIADHPVDIIIMDLILKEGSALAISDYANFRQPNARVIFVTNTSFFSDGSIFSHCSNASALVPAATTPEDLAAMVEHYGSSR
ncbi:MAG: response regulator [Sulfitobacter sp.]